MDKIFAPIIIPTLNRYEHFKRCLESLERCTYADQTDVYVGLDYPPSDKYVEGWKKIDAYLVEKEKNNGFKRLYVKRRNHNYGVGNDNSNGSALMKEVKEVSNCYIFTEDDNEFSPDFLSYCNWGLSFIKKDDRFLAVCGYNLIDTPNLLNNVYIYNHAYCAWGVASWFNRRKKIDDLFDLDKIKHIVDNYSLVDLFNNRVFLASSILMMIKKKHILGDTILQILPENEKWCVFPKMSMVRNYGHDGSGLHGGTQESYQRQINLPIDESTVFEPHIEGDLFTPEIAEAYKAKYGKKSFVYRLRCMGRFLVYKLTGIIIVLERPKWLKRKKK